MGDLLGGRAQLVDRRRHAAGAGGLIVEIAQRSVRCIQHAPRPFIDTEGRRGHLAHRLVDAFDKAVEGGRQLADFIPRLHLQAPGQVAFAEGDILHHAGQHLQRPGNAPRRVPDQQQAEQGRAATEEQLQRGALHALGIELFLQGGHRRQQDVLRHADQHAPRRGAGNR
ncbi:hypothetical protein D3C73_1051550 [compost metagenome]